MNRGNALSGCFLWMLWAAAALLVAAVLVVYLWWEF